MKNLFCLVVISVICLATQAQLSEPIALNTSTVPTHVSDTLKKRFSNSESPDFSFIVNSNSQERTLSIRTNYTGTYKVRFIDYFGGSKRVYKNVSSDFTVNISEFEKSIIIMNITDSRNKILTSQMLNLK